MASSSKQPKRRDDAISSLNTAIEAMNLAKEVSSMTPAKAVFGSVSVLLTMIRDSMANKSDYVELGLTCANVCRALDRGMNGKKTDDLSQSVREAIAQLTTTVAEIQEMVIEKGGRNLFSRLAHARNDKEAIPAWKLDLNSILHIFNTELIMNTHVTVSDIHHGVSKIREEISGQARSVTTQISIPGESPPPPPRACFGRNESIEVIVGLAENLTPIALIGAGGIGKTCIALTVLHHDRVKARFGDSRRFIRCDQFPASRAHFLNRLSKVIGAGVENPEDLAPLRPFLTSRKMILFLDNAESILDPQGADAPEIYPVVEELSELENICLCITSRISTIPPACKTLDVPTLSMAAARDTFYRIHNSRHSDLVTSILEQLDFHPLSITILATVAHHGKWDADRLTREWRKQRTDVLRTRQDKSLSATVELSLASPMFQELGPDARGLLGVVAFFPQGINESNIDWLFPLLSNRANIFDNFCIPSLTYRSNGFITMLAPLRDYICPKDPASSPLLRATKDCYFRRLSVYVDPNEPGFDEARWITSEDVNVEHLLDVFISIDEDPTDVWDACANFITHLFWHKRRLVVLGSRIEGLRDDHPSKPKCLFELSRLFDSIGNHVEQKRLLTHALRLWRERGDDSRVAMALRFISGTNRSLGLCGEGIQQAKEALEIYKRIKHMSGQARSWKELAWLLFYDGQLDAAEEAALRVIDLSSEGDQFPVCESYRLLADICNSKGETEKEIGHLETALGIATRFNWDDQLHRINHSLSQLSLSKNMFDDAQAHVERAKSHAANSPYDLGCTMELQAMLWYKQRRLKEAKSEALRAVDVFEKLGTTNWLEACRRILRDIEEAMANQPSLTTRIPTTPSRSQNPIQTCPSVNGPSRVWMGSHS